MAVYTTQQDRATERLIASLRRRFLWAIAVLMITVALSTFGFVLLDEHDRSIPDLIFEGFWHTLNLVSTVGSLGELSGSEKAWSTLVIVVGLGAVLYGFGSVQGLFQSGDVLLYYVRRKMEKTMRELNGHIVLCGYGGVGRAVAEEVRKAGRKLVIIDESEEATHHADEHGFLVVRADCTDEETLKEAGIARASGLIATLNSDAANVYLILLAREHNPSLRIVSRADRAETRVTLHRAGADRVIVPGESAASQLSNLMLKPRVSEFIAAGVGDGEYDFAELAVADFPDIAGKTLHTLALPSTAEAIVIAILHESGKQTFNPPADYEIKSSDAMIIVCKEGGLEKIAQQF